jgi:hypothetical protein
MKSLLRFLFVLCSVLLFGCGQTIIVNRTAKNPASVAPAPDVANGEKVERIKGMPFYIKKAGCQHHTSWLQPIYTLTLTVTFTPDKPAPDKPSGDSKEKNSPSMYIQSMTMPLWFYDSEDVQELRELLSKPSLTTPKTPQEMAAQKKLVEDITDKWDDLLSKVTELNYKPFVLNEDKLSKCEKNDKQQELLNCDAKQVVKIENLTEPVLYVDYGTIYYYNSSKPLIGSSQASFKLATDGTLSEGSAQVDSKTLQSFLDLFPVKDIVKSAAGLGGTAAKAMLAAGIPADTTGTYKFDLATTVKVYRHTHTAQINAGPPPCIPSTCDVIGSVPGDTCPVTTYNLTVEEVSQAADKKNTDANAISVTGTIKLPKTPDTNAQPTKPN